MSERKSFREMLELLWAKGKFVCLKLDSKLSEEKQRAVIEITNDLVCAYALDATTYGDNVENLCNSIALIRELAPEIPVILEVGSLQINEQNAAGYVDAIFGFLQADAVILPWCPEGEALQPFLERTDKGVIVPFHEAWNIDHNHYAVVVVDDIEDTSELRKIRKRMRNHPIMVTGAQSYLHLEEVVDAIKCERRRSMLVELDSNQLSIDDIGEETKRLHDLIRWAQ